MSMVVVVKYSNGQRPKKLSADTYKLLLSNGLRLLARGENFPDAVRRFLPSGTIGFKTNCLVGRANSTPPALVEALTDLMVAAGFDANDIVVWDRTNRELKRAGFVLNASLSGRRCMGTDTVGIDYSADLYSYGEVNSRVSRILTDVVDHNVNLPVLKDHSIAGMSAGLKNLYGAIHNPNKYHGNNCDPFCAHVAQLAPIRQRHRLTIIDAVTIQYHGGPGYREEYLAPFGGLIMATDPVAADRIGLGILERCRAEHGLGSLEADGRPVKYLETAARLGLGVADLKDIELVERTVTDRDGPLTE